MFEAGRYAAYVWPAYGISAAVVLWLTVDALLSSRRWRRKAEARKGRKEDAA